MFNEKDMRIYGIGNWLGVGRGVGRWLFKTIMKNSKYNNLCKAKDTIRLTTCKLNQQVRILLNDYYTI